MDALETDDALGATDAAPEGFTCPITHVIMRDPVTTADGHSCECMCAAACPLQAQHTSKS